MANYSHEQMYRKATLYGGVKRAVSKGKQVTNNYSFAILTTYVWIPAYHSYENENEGRLGGLVG